MRIKSSISFIIFIVSAFSVFGQSTPQPTPTPSRPRVIVTNNLPSPTPTPTPRPTPTVSTSPTEDGRPIVVVSNSPMPVSTPQPTTTPIPFGTPFPKPTPRPTPLPNSYKGMTYGQLKNRIQQAKSLMQTRPLPTSQVDSISTEYVRLAVFDWKRNDIDFIVMSKANFLVTNAEIATTTSEGKNVFVRVIRANGVNTPVVVFDENNQPLTPLVVQYPIERNGAFAEMAYYTSTHTGIVLPEVINAGKLYIRNTIDIARDKLRQKGIFIQPQIANIAERLATVEHVDHARFRNEYHLNIYHDIFTLFALNEGNTYRYSVSRAGAGGMVQMIPSTYYMVRNRYYSVGLMPDFVEGMRNHVNACQAMLLYMQWTWDDLSSRETIYTALENGTATQAELMAAGYNSNPANLPKYIKRGGNNWRNLIPRETRIYLQIYSSLERFIPMQPRVQ